MKIPESLQLLVNLQNWSLDIKSVAVTILAIPLIAIFVTIIQKYIKEWGTYLIEGLMFHISKYVRGSLAGRLTLKHYCRLRLEEDNRYLHVPSSLDIKLEVDDAFVTLLLEHQGGQRDLYDHNNILNIGSRIRVLGDPGSGKSSLVKRLMRDACRKAIKNPKNSKLPILLELKKLNIKSLKKAEDPGIWYFQKIKTEVANYAAYLMDDCFDTFSKSNGLLILLDGLDEVSSTDYPIVQSAIDGLSRVLAGQGKNNVIVLTMRTQFHQQVKDFYRESFGHAVYLRPFTPTNIYEFLSLWPFGENKKDQINRIYKDLTDRSSLREMCSNPLVLSMYVAEDQAKGHLVAPESRTEFYKKVTDELLIKRRLAQTGPAPAHTTLKEQRERILGQLAYDHMLNEREPTNSLSWHSAIRVVQQVMKCNEVEAARKFREIAKETGLITEERLNETFRFIHLTFCEFLAAFEAVHGQSEGWRELIATHNSFQQQSKPQLRSRLIEVLPFACGLLPRVKRTEAVSDIANLFNNGLLARTFLETKLYDHDRWPVFTENWKQRLLMVYENAWNDDLLQELHLFNVVMRDANLCANHMAQIANVPDLDSFYSELLKKQQQSLATLLRAYASQDAAASFRMAELNHLNLAIDLPEVVLDNCDQAPFFALILEQAAHEQNNPYRWAALLAEAALRSKFVAKSMYELPPLKEWEPIAEDVPVSQRWALPDLFDKSLYTQCITIALKPNYQLTDSTPLLKLIKNIPPPGGNFYLRVYLIFTLSFLLTSILAFQGLAVNIISKPLSVLVIYTMVYLSIPLLATLFIYYALIRRVGAKILYHELLFQAELPYFKKFGLLKLYFPLKLAMRVNKQLFNNSKLLIEARRNALTSP